MSLLPCLSMIEKVWVEVGSSISQQLMSNQNSSQQRKIQQTKLCSHGGNEKDCNEYEKEG